MRWAVGEIIIARRNAKLLVELPNIREEYLPHNELHVPDIFIY